MTIFYKNFVALCAEKGYSESGAAKAIGLSNAAASGWKKGKIPSSTTQQKLASLFNVPIEYLLADETKKQRPADGEALISELPGDIRELIEICKERPALASALLAVAQQIETRSSAQE